MKWFCVLLSILLITGCGAGDRPRMRIGCLPYPGPLTLHQLADPDHLGHHRYGDMPYDEYRPTECQHGIVYTCKAGFLDMAHLRSSIDWTRYMRNLIRMALIKEKEQISFKAEEPSRYVLTFDYPTFWWDMPPDEKLHFIDEISILQAQRLSYIRSTWHEVITWYGYKMIILVSERASAFTYDDMVSHLIGIQVASEVLRDTTKRSYDEVVTDVLHRRLVDLGIVSQSEAEQALERVRDRWWFSSRRCKRFLDLGFDDGTVKPWLVGGLVSCEEDEARSFLLPNWNEVMGYDCSSMIRVEIRPNIFEALWIRRDLSNECDEDRTSTSVSVERDFLILLDLIHERVIDVYGEEFVKP